MGRGLATEWQKRGHEVTVTTKTPLEGSEEIDDLAVIRRPSFLETIQLMRWADVFVQNGASLRSLPFPLITRTPFVSIHQSPPIRPGSSVPDGLRQWTTHLRRMNVAVSGAVAEYIPGPVTKIPNTFRSIFDQIDVEQGDENRDGLLFVGRLVSEKGADLAIEALHELRRSGINRTLTICGDGPERTILEKKVYQCGLDDAVTFNGWTSPETLARLYRKAEVAVIPSRDEPFGIVALEAIASGCPVVASNVGGLPEAVGDCGLVVKPDRPMVLADAVETALDPDTRASLQMNMPAHTAQHRIGQIAKEYLNLLKSTVARPNE